MKTHRAVCLSYTCKQLGAVLDPCIWIDSFIVCALPSKTKNVFILSFIQSLCHKYFNVSNLLIFFNYTIHNFHLYWMVEADPKWCEKEGCDMKHRSGLVNIWLTGWHLNCPTSILFSFFLILKVIKLTVWPDRTQNKCLHYIFMSLTDRLFYLSQANCTLHAGV